VARHSGLLQLELAFESLAPRLDHEQSVADPKSPQFFDGSCDLGIRRAIRDFFERDAQLR
jgi:hypothetical protein